MSRWFKSAVKAKPMIAAEEDAHLQDVEFALLQLLNDDIEAANAILQKSDSSYHHLGRGISGFIGAVLGAEKELLKDAANTLQIAENKTWEDMKIAQKERTAYQSKIYAPGTEYQLCYAISQLTSAITAVMSGSVTEAVKGFYKLRKAYLTLDGILEVEKAYLKKTGAYHEEMPLNPVLEDYEKTNTTVIENGARNPSEEVGEKSYEPIRTQSRISTKSTSTLPVPRRMKSNLLQTDPADLGITSHTDIFIHSGTRLCYGILLVIFSMIENPIFNRILYIVGFKGDLERGTRYLWEASRFDNFNSAISGIALLGYYNGLTGACDILPTDPRADDDLQGFPRGKCKVLLTDMRRRYPDSRLWKMEEARMLSNDRKLRAALDILTHNSDSNMKQIATINIFEQGLTSLAVLDFELCAKSWIQCAELGSWSPCLYSYMTGIAYLELYRDFRDGDPGKAKVYKEKATEYIRKGPPLSGRQTFMGQELPFDIFIGRKVKKWELRAKEWGVDLVDAIGVSPLVEQIYLWNGVKKQSVEEINRGLELLDWNRTNYPEKHKLDVDETALNALLRSCLFRNLQKYDQARNLLTSEVLKHNRSQFKPQFKDDWTLPFANYEMAVLAWVEKDLPSADHKAKIVECEQWIQKVKNWGEAYTLDTRLSFKIGTSVLTVKRHREIMGM